MFNMAIFNDRTHFCILCFSLLLTASISVGFSESFEPNSRSLDYSAAVSKSVESLRSGEFHTTRDEVFVEYGVNHFILETQFGEISVVSNQQLNQTIAELPAIAEISKISKAGALGGSVVELGKATVNSTVSIVKNPLKKAKNIPGGFTRMVTSTKEDAAKAQRFASGETSATESLNPGVEIARRNLCLELGVDPYSRNPILQAELKRVSGVMSVGAYSSEKMKEVLEDAEARGALNSNEKIWNFKPHELLGEIEKELSELGVDGELVDTLIGNQVYTLSELFILSESLVSIGSLPGLDQFIEIASLAQTVYDALFYVDIAEFYARYNKDNPLMAFTIIGLVPAGIENDDTLVVYTASDHITWTEALANRLVEVSPGLANEYKSMEIVTYGLFSPISMDQLSALGWKSTELERY